ncbi:MAG: SulP family inorganic anion transporter [Gammaproteobacteria bacterium]|nr:SulP family inorganic anion transporter [Gammaproteobacteria bacterium]
MTCTTYRDQHFKFDFIAAIVVCLVAIPLCLGIALASNAPLFSGLLGGIIGGILVGTLSGSSVSVSGPAAGMATVVVAAIANLNGFQNFLLALTLAGLLQIMMGVFRAGFMSDYIPSNVVQGLLCAIGILLIVKQLPLAFTLSQNLLELKTHLLETTEELAVKPVYTLYYHLNGGATLLSLISFAILIYFEKTKRRFIRRIPASIVVVIVSILLNDLFGFLGSSFVQTSPQLVQIPKHDNFLAFLHNIQFPNWQAWSNPAIYLNALIIAIVASLESILNLKAGEKLDKKKRPSPANQELIAQGIGNLAAGLLGAIPITSVIVRTSVNIQAGSRTKMSAILHGVFLLFAILFIPAFLNKIPLSALAAILIFTGYKLTKPSIYKNMYRQGLNRFIPFIATVVSIVAFNLLEGILIGLAISFFYILKSHSQARLDIIKENHPNGMTHRLVLPQQISFLNKASLVAEMNDIPHQSNLIIDARYANYIDQDIIEFIQEFRDGRAKNNHISLDLIGFKDHYDIHNFIDFINVTTYDLRSSLHPAAVLSILKEGNHRFLNDTRIHRSAKMDIQQTSTAQNPIAVVLACIDSRVPVETIFDMSFGDLFCIRIAANVINDDILASIEYACAVVGAKLIVVLGHTQCGAIQAACDGVETGHLGTLLAKIKPAILASTQAIATHTNQEMSFIQQVTQCNVANTMLKIYQESGILKDMIEEESIGIVGGVYDISSGFVTFNDYSSVLNQLRAKKHDTLAKKISLLFNYKALS